MRLLRTPVAVAMAAAALLLCAGCRATPPATMLVADEVPGDAELHHRTGAADGEGDSARPASFLWCGAGITSLPSPWLSSIAYFDFDADRSWYSSLAAGVAGDGDGSAGETLAVEVAAAALVDEVEGCEERLVDLRADGDARGDLYSIEELSGLPEDTLGWRVGERQRESDVTEWGEFAVTLTPDGRVLVVGVTTVADALPYSIGEALEMGRVGAERVAGSRG